MGRCQGRGFILGKMERNIVVNLKMTSSKDSGFSGGLTEGATKVSGIKGSSMEKAGLLILMELLELASGRMVFE
jgi:hypothetical protein